MTERPQYLLDRERDIKTIQDSIDKIARRRGEYEARLREEEAWLRGLAETTTPPAE